MIQPRYETTVYGVEHSGDERRALEELREKGATKLRVISRPYLEEHGAECIVVTFEHPRGLRGIQ